MNDSDVANVFQRFRLAFQLLQITFLHRLKPLRFEPPRKAASVFDSLGKEPLMSGLLLVRREADKLLLNANGEEVLITVEKIGSTRVKLRIEADRDQCQVTRFETIEKREA